MTFALLGGGLCRLHLEHLLSFRVTSTTLRPHKHVKNEQQQLENFGEQGVENGKIS